jgi:hypothetical protein
MASRGILFAVLAIIAADIAVTQTNVVRGNLSVVHALQLGPRVMETNIVGAKSKVEKCGQPCGCVRAIPYLCFPEVGQSCPYFQTWCEPAVGTVEQNIFQFSPHDGTPNPGGPPSPNYCVAPGCMPWTGPAGAIPCYTTAAADTKGEPNPGHEAGEAHVKGTELPDGEGYENWGISKESGKGNRTELNTELPGYLKEM